MIPREAQVAKMREAYIVQLRDIAKGVAKSEMWRSLTDEEKKSEIALTMLIGGEKLEQYLTATITRRSQAELTSYVINIAMNRMWTELSEEKKIEIITTNLERDLPQYTKTRAYYTLHGVEV